MTLDEVQRLADKWRAVDKREYVAYIADDLAAAVRMLLPVVRAAEAWLTRLEARGGLYRDGVPGDLFDAVDQMHSLLQTKEAE